MSRPSIKGGDREGGVRIRARKIFYHGRALRSERRVKKGLPSLYNKRAQTSRHCADDNPGGLLPKKERSAQARKITEPSSKRERPKQTGPVYK